MATSASNVEVLSSEDLRNRLFDTLKKRGLVDSLKTQLRNRLVAELRQIGAGQTFESGGARSVSLIERAVSSLIAEHLRVADLEYSLSVFLPEAGLSPDKIMATEDILQLLQISTQSKLYKKLMDGGNKGRQQNGLLWKLLGESVNKRLAVDNGTQTESSGRPWGASLEEELRKVDAHFLNAHGDLSVRGAAVEERILTYQRQLEERSASELQLQIARFKQNELVQLKLLEGEKVRKQIDKARREMEGDYRLKYEALAERERNASEQIHRLQEVSDKDTYAQRQLLLEEIEAVRQREVAMRRQDEANHREKQQWEERIKTREELARRAEEAGRKLEQEQQHRITEQVNRFKQEEQAKYLDRLRSLEYREERVKGSEARVNEELQSTTNIRVELRDKRADVHRLEEELIGVKQEFLAAQKQLDLLKANSNEMINFQSVKEGSAVLKKELDTARLRIAELTRDALVERQKHEELLREVGHVAGMPTSETFLLKRQVEQLQNTLRTERALGDHTRTQNNQRLDLETDRNKQLLMEYQDEAWKHKQLNWSAADMRQQLIDTKHALNNEVRRRDFRPDSPYDARGSMAAIDPSLYVEGVDPRLMAQSPYSTTDGLGLDTAMASDEGSYSSDLVKDTKQRIQRLETEAERLERNYQEFQFRITNINPVSSPPYLGRSKAELSAAGSTSGVGERKNQTQAARDGPPTRHAADQSRLPTQYSTSQSNQPMLSRTGIQQGSEVPKAAGKSYASGSLGRDVREAGDRSPRRNQVRSPESNQARSPGRSQPKSPSRNESKSPGRHQPSSVTSKSVEPTLKAGSSGAVSDNRNESNRSPRRAPPESSIQRPVQTGSQSIPTGSQPVGTRSGPMGEGASNGSSPERIVGGRGGGGVSPTRAVDGRGSGGASGEGGSLGTEGEPEVRVSLDDAWKSRAEPAADRGAKVNQTEGDGRNAEDRSVLYDDKSFKSGRGKEPLPRQQQQQQQRRAEGPSGGEDTSVSDMSPPPAGAKGPARAKGPGGAKGSAQPEEDDSKIDPVMLKYMKMVQEQKEKEKQEEQEESVSPSEDDISIPEQNSDENFEVEGDDNKSW